MDDAAGVGVTPSDGKERLSFSMEPEPKTWSEILSRNAEHEAIINVDVDGVVVLRP